MPTNMITAEECLRRLPAAQRPGYRRWVLGDRRAPRPGFRRFMTRRGISGLGQRPRQVGRTYVGMGQPEPTMVDQIRTIYQGVSSLDPLIQMVGNHPWLTITMAMGAILAGSALGGYIGAGVKADEQRRRRR